jgi:hypothetical protein
VKSDTVANGDADGKSELLFAAVFLYPNLVKKDEKNDDRY